MNPANTNLEQTAARRAIAVAALAALAALAWPAALALGDPAPKLRHPATIDSAYFAFALWAGATLLVLQAKPAEWRSGRPTFRAARTAWGLAWLLLAVHVGYAFHFAHGWSHAHAVGHVERTAGFGPGIFVSYAFALLWLLDVLWMSIFPAGYAARPPWAGRILHAFFAFIVFNGTVVFGHGFMRWVCAGVFALLLGQAAYSARSFRQAAR